MGSRGGVGSKGVGRRALKRFGRFCAGLSRSGLFAALASLGMVALFTMAGMAALPLRGSLTTWTFVPAIPDAARPDPVTSNASIPVLTLRPDHTTIRSGFAGILPDGRIRVTLYDPGDPLLAQASEAALFNADLRTLWMLATDAERAELRQGFSRLGAAVRQAADETLRSPEFNDEYRPALQEIVRTAVERAWRMPTTAAAYDEMMRAAEPVIRDTLSREVRPLLVRRLDGLLWDMVQANVGTMFDVFGQRQWNTAPLELALEAAIRDIRELSVVERMTGHIVANRQTKSFIQIFAGNVMDALATDPAVEAILMRLVTDPRMTKFLAPLAQPAGDISRMAPRILFGVRANADLNAMSAYSFNGFLNARTGPVVILMSPEQRDQMLLLDPRAPRLLVRSATP